jgi:outer membrane lipoprotein-sorting protein
MKTSLSIIAASVAVAVIAPAAHADEAGNKALAAVDAATNRAKTQLMEMDATVKSTDKADRKLALAVSLKGDKRLTEFLAPSDVKGTKVLVLSPTQMYIYLPAYKKVRRVASHVTDQGFMGMTFSQDDFSLSRYSPQYGATIAKDDGKTVKLTLTPKADQKPPYAKIEMTVEKARSLPLEIKYFNDAGTHLKTETRTSYSCEGDVCAPVELKMVDHTKGGLSTTMVRKSWKVNTDIPDSKFTQRALEE